VRVLVSNGELKPTRANILYELELLSRKVKTGDIVFVLYSGHGIDLGNESYLLPYDTDPRSEFVLRNSALGTETFTQALGQLNATGLVLAFDMCRNNPFKGDRAATSTANLTAQQARDLVLKPVDGGKGVRAAVTLFSCSVGERSWEWRAKKRGFFSYFLEEGLRRGAGSDGVVRVKDLVSYLESVVPQTVKREINNEQTPWSKVEGTGALNLVLAQGVKKPADLTPIDPITNTVEAVPTLVVPNDPTRLAIGSTKLNPQDGAAMVWVPAGEFTMGDIDGEDEVPQRRVYVDGYWVYKNLVTVAQYRRFCTATGRQMPEVPSWGWQDTHPVVNVSWEDAKAYCEWAGTSLPTEAQWEKAARGVDGRMYPWGNEFSTSHLWSSKKEGGDAKSTAPVGSFPSGASPYGALDMAGNVWQWCADWYDEKYYANAPKRNPTGPNTGQSRVLRGGSWDFVSPVYFRTVDRDFVPPGFYSHFVGFRCVQGLN
jgi:formylglycine-generating enzyme required for sulfatase activity